MKIACKRIAKLVGAPKASPKTPVAAPATPPAAKKVAIAKPKPENVVVTILRVPDGVPVAPNNPTASSAKRVNEMVARLRGMKAARPARLATLKSSLKAWFKPALTDKQLAEVIKALTDSKKVRLDRTKSLLAMQTCPSLENVGQGRFPVSTGNGFEAGSRWVDLVLPLLLPCKCPAGVNQDHVGVL